MAYELIKVSELPELTTPSDPNVIPIQDGDYLKRISFENLKEAATEDVADDLAAEVTARESAVSDEATARGNADAAILADLASAYSASATYAVGDYCIYSSQLYRCTTAITTAEAWTAAHWTAVQLGDDTSTLRSALNSLNDEIFYEKEKSIEWVTGLCNVGNFTTKAGDKVSKPFTLYKDETVSVTTKGDGAYLFRVISQVPSLDIPIASGCSGGTKIALITVNTLKTYTHTATEDEYIVLGGLDDPTTVVTFENLKKFSNIDRLDDEIDALSEHGDGILKDKSVMLFGDSLTAASTNGVYGFAKRIADYYGTPYKLFVRDSQDGNPQDVPVDYPRITNYAKDGTTNRIVSGRTDSVVERVKRHIDADTLVDYVLIECCVNDMAQALRNKGEISDSYTATFDTTTTIGSLEETLRYLTTLGKPLRVGGYIPWTIVWQATGWFDDYAAVFEKWGVPLFDMRKTAGFDMQHYGVHRLLYSLTADSYDAYDATATYNLDDKVKYGGLLYKCLANGVTGIAPTNTTYWMEVSSESADGTHLNTIGHGVVAGKIQHFMESM